MGKISEEDWGEATTAADSAAGKHTENFDKYQAIKKILDRYAEKAGK